MMVVAGTQLPVGLKPILWIAGGPAERAGIQRGDVLEAIGNKKVASATDVSRRLYELGVWSKATYSLKRGETHFTTTVIVAPQETHLRFKRFLEFVGFLYLFIGVFIFLRRWQASGALHFYAICIVSFVVYAFSYTNKLNEFDWTIYWLDEIWLPSFAAVVPALLPVLPRTQEPAEVVSLPRVRSLCPRSRAGRCSGIVHFRRVESAAGAVVAPCPA
jgi:hypothetical protein